MITVNMLLPVQYTGFKTNNHYALYFIIVNIIQLAFRCPEYQTLSKNTLIVVSLLRKAPVLKIQVPLNGLILNRISPY